MNGVGPQWHHDGSFEKAVFSHVGYHIVSLHETGGDTMFAHVGSAYDALPPEKQAYWQQLVSFNSQSGVLHPLVTRHPISRRRTLFLHLGMTGGVLRKDAKENKFDLLQHDELVELMVDYNDLLNAGLLANGGRYAVSYQWNLGDVVFTDNLAVAHKASAKAHVSPSTNGLRVIHRTPVKGIHPLLPPFSLPAVFNRQLLDDSNSSGNGVLVTGAAGFRWSPTEPIKNMATDFEQYYKKQPLDMDWLG